MPGLADMHMHTRDDWNKWLSDWPVSPLYLYLANGVTTIRCFGPHGDSFGYVLRWKDKINSGQLIGPTIHTSGPIIYGPLSNPMKIVREQIAKGFDFIKLYSFLSREEFHMAMITAKKAGMYTAGHIPFQVGLEGVLSEGMDEIAHIEELSFEFVDFDRNKGLTGREWMPYIIKTAYQQVKPYFGLNMEELDEKFGEPLYGKVETRGGTFEGFIQWDHDECLSTDELDGESEDGDVEIPFGRIRSIEKYRRGSLVVLETGRELYLTGSNDVDNDNQRGGGQCV